MSIATLIAKFSDRYVVGIDIDEVVEALRGLGVTDEIYYWWDEERDTHILRGDIERWSYPNGEGKENYVVDITYGKMGNDFERLVCCKELLHILEPEYAKVNTEEKFEKLLESMVPPFEIINVKKDGIEASIDKVAVLQALAILFPLNARNVLIEPYEKGTLTLQQIAEIVELPPSYTYIVLNGRWPQLHQGLLDLGL